MKVFILAGGFGTRLSHIVKDVPKPMAPIQKKPFLEVLIMTLKKQGFSDIVLLTGHKSEIIENHFKDGSAFGVHIEYSIETEPLGTGGAIKQAAENFVSEGDFMVLNGDTYFDADLTALVRFHQDNKAGLTIALKYREDVKRYGMVRTKDYQVLEFIEKNPDLEDGYINGGIYVINKNALTSFKKRGFLSFESEVMPLLLKENKVLALPFGGRFIDIGVPDDYFQADSTLLEWIEEEKIKVAFLDRDGIINVDSGYSYKKENLKLVPGIIPFLKGLRALGYHFVIVTNQAGIGKGKYTEDDFREFQAELELQFLSEDLKFLDTYFCPYHPEAVIPEYRKVSLLRKPSPAMVLQAADKHCIDIAKSVMIGDKASDVLEIPYLRTYLLRGIYDLKNQSNAYDSFDEILKMLAK